jgi:DnaJ-class molecular chaperone
MGGDIEASLTLSFWEALRGCKKEIQLKVERTCVACNGNGTKKNSFGRQSGCNSCHGLGKGMHSENLTVTIPAGVETGSIVRLKGKGQLGVNGAASGNLLIKITAAEDSHYRRNGQDLHLEIPISLEEALLGSKIQIPTGCGEVTLKIPPSTTGKKKLRLTAKGVANSKTGENGDLIVDLKIILPDKMTEEAKGHLLRFSQLLSYNPRPNWKN